MSSLVNQKIKDTYEGLIKTSDEQPIDGTLKNLQDGNGGVLPIQVSTSTINFTGAVTGISAGGLLAGTGANSMESGITTTPADARGINDIVIGDGAQSRVDATFGSNVVIGNDATQTGGERGVVIGFNATMSKAGISIGANTDNNSGQGIAIGNNAATGSLDESCAIGFDASSIGNAGSLAVGRNSSASGINPTCIGRNSSATNNAIAAGYNAVASGNESTAIGTNTDATASLATALGYTAQATAAGAIALGEVTASTVDTTTLKLLQIANYATINFADDAAAATGGIPLGGVYHTSGALKIRIA